MVGDGWWNKSASGTTAWVDYCTDSTASTDSNGWMAISGGKAYRNWSVSYQLSKSMLFKDDDGHLVAEAGQTIKLPDGSHLILDDLGNYRVEDKDAKVQYRANRMRDFSPHLNASDLLAQFVRYVGSLGVRQAEVDRLQDDFLRQNGWEHTSDTPGCLWLW